MKRLLPHLGLIFILPSLLSAQTVLTLKVDGTINPASAEYIHRGIELAQERKAECAVIELNTPGGLLKSTRVIVSDLLEARVPVVVFVAPGGAHAGSAGVFITLAAHIAAMAPGTNIGAAHPVSTQGQMDTIMNEKATNDAAAFIRTIAEKRKRNLKWAEEAVTKSQAITESEALKMGVIDLVARDIKDLLKQIDGKRIAVISDTVQLHTANASLEVYEMEWNERFLDVLSDPNIAYILFLVGLYGLLFELYNPGSIFPGVIGVISLILAFYSMHTLPINYAGVGLILFGVILFILEIKIVSHGILGIGGVISLLLGSVMLIRTESVLEFAEISWAVILTSVALTAFFFLFVIGLGIRAQRQRPTTGIEGLVGEIGEAMTKLSPTGTVKVRGEIWNADAAIGQIQKGEKVRVVEVRNLTLRVELIKQM